VATRGHDAEGLAIGAGPVGFDGVGAADFFIGLEASGDDNGDVAGTRDLGFKGALVGDCGLDGVVVGDETDEVALTGDLDPSRWGLGSDPGDN
jgi:hypothetical protein